MIFKKYKNESLFKELVKIFLGFRLFLFLTIIFSIVFIAINIVKPYILSQIFDKGVAEKSLPIIFQLTFYNLIIMIASGLLSIVHTYYISSFANKFIFKIRMLFYNYMNDLPVCFYEKTSPGDIMSRLDTDVQEIRDYILYDVTQTYTTLINFIGTAIFISVMQWRILIANMLILPVIAIVLKYFRKILYKWAMEVKRKMSEVFSVIVWGFSQIIELKATNFELYFLQRVKEKYLQLIEKSVKNSVIKETSSSLIQFVINLTYIITIGYGGFLIVNGYMTAGMLLAFLTMRSQIVAPVQSVSNLYSKYFTVKASYYRLKEYYDQPKENGIEIMDEINISNISPGNLRIEELSFAYDNSKRVLENLTLEFTPGEWVGIRGNSGIGKTTLMKLMLKLIIPQTGEIIYCGEFNTKMINNRKWRSLIGYVSQKSFAFNETIRENILMGRNSFSDDDIWKALQICALDQDIEQFPDKLDTIISENGAVFSGGMIKRLMLARMILEPKKILLLDEILASIDIYKSRQILQNLRNSLPKDTIVLLISHREDDFTECDKIIEIKGSEIEVIKSIYDEVLTE